MNLTQLLDNKQLQEKIKEGFVLKAKVQSPWAKEVVVEYTESTCYLDKTGYTFRIETNGYMPVYPMRSANYIQAYGSFKRMVTSLVKLAEGDLEVVKANI